MYFDLTKGNLSFIGKTRHHQDFHLNDAWFMFSNPVRQMPYISNFRGLLFYGHLSKAGSFFNIIYSNQEIRMQLSSSESMDFPHKPLQYIC